MKVGDFYFCRSNSPSSSQPSGYMRVTGFVLNSGQRDTTQFIGVPYVWNHGLNVFDVRSIACSNWGGDLTNGARSILIGTGSSEYRVFDLFTLKGTVDFCFTIPVRIIVDRLSRVRETLSVLDANLPVAASFSSFGMTSSHSGSSVILVGDSQSRRADHVIMTGRTLTRERWLGYLAALQVPISQLTTMRPWYAG